MSAKKQVSFRTSYGTVSFLDKSGNIKFSIRTKAMRLQEIADNLFNLAHELKGMDK